jgi:DNA-binding response OmpR family regulator
MTRKILLVEDELRNRLLVEEALRPDGYIVHSVGSVRDALLAFARDTFDLVLLDVMLPDGDGFSLCREIRQKSHVPIIMMTAKADASDVVAGLELGADDYIVKPFHVRTAVARVRAQLRRATELNSPVEEDAAITTGALKIDPAVRDALVDGVPARLTPKEFDLLYFLGTRKGRAVSKDALIQHLWGDDEDRSERILAVYVRHLREKIESEPESPRYLQTLRGFGYRLSDDPHEMS